MVTIADLILSVLSARPCTGFEITRALEDEHRVLLRGREGAVYAALLEMEKGGFVTSRESEDERERSRRVYELPVLTDLGAPPEAAS